MGLGILTGGAGQAVGSLVAPATEAGKGVYQYLKQKYDYIKNLHHNFTKLDREAGYLSSRLMDVRDKIGMNRGTMQPTLECAAWLEDVRRIMVSVEELKTRYKETSNGCCGSCLSRTRLKLSKEIVETTNSVIDVKNRMDTNCTILAERPPDKVEKKFPKSINEVPSLHEHVEKLLELLKDDNMKKIGIWGMPGVGKTTILENLNDKAENLQVFEKVLWVTVPKERNLYDVQREILRQLGVTIENVQTQMQAGVLISRTLENMRYLLLLDEVFWEFDLRHIGIHDSHLHGKVVLTAREKKICISMTDEDIKVERMSRDDARKLFRGAVGDAFNHPLIKPTAELVLKQCGELPHIIRGIGSHLKGKLSEDFWRNTLSELRSPNMYQLKDMEDVFSTFKIIFDGLHDTLKNCLLYAASFPEDHEIYRDYLIECWRAEQLIGIDETFKRTREEGHSNLDILIDKCLFDRCKSYQFVKMPIVFRNTALRMADQNNYELFLRHDEESEYPSDRKWVNAKVISLMNSNLVQLPSKPDCSMVSTLFLQKNENLSVVPPSFFTCMSTLKILDLCGTSIDSLPSSISILISLKALYLNDCGKLVHLPREIGQLHNLELLDICRSGIQGFPSVIGFLTHLRCLRVSFTSVVGNQNCVKVNGIQEPPFEAIQWVPHLEELTIDADPKDPKWNIIAPRIAEKVADLEKLSTLSFCFPSTVSLESFIQTSKSWKNGSSQPGSNFRSFNIIVGSQRAHKFPRLDVPKWSGQRYFQYSGGMDMPDVVKEVIGRTYAFELIAHQNITNFSDLAFDGMECLEFCRVEGCNALTAFLNNQMPAPATPAFQWLRELQLLELQQLNAICRGLITPGSFGKLTTLTLYDCPNVTEVVSWELAIQLRELQHLNVEKCPQVKEIISGDNQSIQSAVRGAFPKLETVKLVMLEGLVSIHCDDSFVWRELQHIEILHCEKLVNLRLSTMNASKLRCIRCNESWWGKVMVNCEVATNLQRFCSFSRSGIGQIDSMTFPNQNV